jgi:DNA polymerase-3 subunit delta'
MLFKDIVGQETLKKRLAELVNKGRISHAQLFLGKMGHGALPMAIAYSQYISCKNRGAEDSCGNCPSCLKFNKLSHPDLHFSFPFNKNEKIKEKLDALTSDHFISTWRETVLANPYLNIDDWHRSIDIDQKQSVITVNESKSIAKKLSLKSYESEYKLLILWMPEKMRQDAANKLLKLIEEPEEKTLLILVAEDAEALINTIISRTQIVRIPPIESVSIKNYLTVHKNVEDQQAKRFAQLAQGSLTEALDLLDRSEEDDLFFELFKQWMRACYKADIKAMSDWVEDASRSPMGRESRKRFLVYALEIMREGIILNYTNGELRRMLGVEQAFMQNFAPFVHSENIVEITEVLNDAHYHISRNAYPKIVFMDMSMKFANLLRVKKRTFVS